MLITENQNLLDVSEARKRYTPLKSLNQPEKESDKSNMEYSVEDALEHIGFGIFQLRIIAVGSLFMVSSFILWLKLDF